MLGTEASPKTFRFGVFEVDLEAAELRKHGIRIKLQEQPFQILALLLEHPDRLVTRQELRTRLWPNDTFVDFDSSLNKAMTKLRSALGDSAENPRYIETLHRRGYRFLAPVHAGLRPSGSSPQTPAAAASGPETPAVAAEISGPDAAAVQDLRSLRKVLRRTGSKPLYLTAIAAVLLLAAGLYFYPRAHRLAAVGDTPTARRSIAVLGFQNLSGDPHEAWLSSALSDWLITELSAGEQLRTVPAQSVARMKMELSLPPMDSLDRNSLAQIRENLGADFVIAGSYALLGQGSAGQIRLDLLLQDARNAKTLDAISETGNESDLFDLVSKVGQDLRARLGVGAVTEREASEVASALPWNPQAARAYAEGLDKLRVFNAPAGRNLLLEAVAAEPDFALAHAALASAWAQLGYDDRARVEAHKAVALSGKLSRTQQLQVQAQYSEMSGDWTKALHIYRALLEFYPDSLEYGLALAHAQVRAGRGVDALRTIASLRNLPEPLRDDPRIDLAEDEAAETLGNYKEDLAAARRAAAKAQQSGATLILARACLDEAWAYENLGHVDKVDGVIRRAVQFYTAAHDQEGVSAAQTDRAIALEMEGNYLSAKQGYQASLAYDRKLGTKLSVAADEDNIGDTLYYLGDLKDAQTKYGQSLALYSELHHEDGVALAEIGLGKVLLAMGNHAQAKTMFENAIQLCRQVGDRSKEAGALSGLGTALWMEGDFTAAQSDEAQAKAIFAQIGDKSSAAKSHLHLAELLLDQGKTSQAAAFAGRAAATFQQTQSASDRGAADLILARIFLAQHHFPQARKSADDALAVARGSGTLKLHMEAKIVCARIQAASGSSGRVLPSENALKGIIAKATQSGFLNVALSARLALGEIEIESGHASRGRWRLLKLERYARQGGYLLISRKAAAALHQGPEQSGLPSSQQSSTTGN